MGEEKKIEILFPEFCNLAGDSSNMRYLKKCMPKAEFIETRFDEEMAFVKEKIDLIYLGPMTESRQEKVIEKLKPYTEIIKQKIEENVVFLFTGNAFEVMGEYIENEDGSKIEALGIFPIHSKRDMMNRHNSLFKGIFEDIEIVGFKSQFSMSYGKNEDCYFAKVEHGIGINPKSNLEGIYYHHFIGTYVIGPILILNPLFTKKVMQMMGIENPYLAFAQETMDAYKQRLKEID